MGEWGRKLSEVDEAPKGPLVGTPSTLHYHMKLFINNALDLHFFKKKYYYYYLFYFILFFEYLKYEAQLWSPPPNSHHPHPPWPPHLCCCNLSLQPSSFRLARSFMPIS